VIKLSFTPPVVAGYFDTLVLGDSCGQFLTLLSGVGYSTKQEFYLTSINASAVDASQDTMLLAQIVNQSASRAIVIDSMWVDDPVHFIPSPDASKSWVWVASKKDSLSIPLHGIAFVNFKFHPEGPGFYTSRWYAHSADIENGTGETGIRSNVLTVVANQAASVQNLDPASLMLRHEGSVLEVVADGPAKLEIVNILGSRMLTVNVLPNDPIDIRSLRSGVYFYRLSAASEHHAGKIFIP
jgi:hypothetical protein